MGFIHNVVAILNIIHDAPYFRVNFHPHQIPSILIPDCGLKWDQGQSPISDISNFYNINQPFKPFCLKRNENNTSIDIFCVHLGVNMRPGCFTSESEFSSEIPPSATFSDEAQESTGP